MTRWTKVANYLAFSIIGLGFIVIYFGWNGAANKDCVDCQIPYLISGGMAGLGLIITGLGVLVVQTIQRGQALMRQELSSLQPPEPSSDTGLRLVSDDGLVVAGSSSYHRPDCRLAAGRNDSAVMSSAQAEAQGLSACRVCNPA